MQNPFCAYWGLWLFVLVCAGFLALLLVLLLVLFFVFFFFFFFVLIINIGRFYTRGRLSVQKDNASSTLLY